MDCGLLDIYIACPHFATSYNFTMLLKSNVLVDTL